MPGVDSHTNTHRHTDTRAHAENLVLAFFFTTGNSLTIKRVVLTTRTRAYIVVWSVGTNLRSVQ